MALKSGEYGYIALAKASYFHKDFIVMMRVLRVEAWNGSSFKENFHGLSHKSLF